MEYVGRWYDEPSEWIGISFFFTSLSSSTPSRLKFVCDDEITRDIMVNMINELINEQLEKQRDLFARHRDQLEKNKGTSHTNE